ncbi:MAG TPA: YciI family protein [Candidatus Angelobacter sp.]|nr:YciI family protein [Candidatus Angelobacter sp.]
MQYLLLIYDAEANWNAVSEAERQKMYGQYMDLTQDLQKNGKYKSGNQLQPIASAATVRIRDGKKTITDGPFAETKEQLGGYYLVEAKDRDEALAIAARIPSARLGCVEVRPVVMR